MTSPPLPEVDLADLGPRTRIGAGGQGSVYALAEEPGVVYKEYATRLVDDVDVATLHRFVRLAAEAGPPLLDLAAWPTAVVRKEGVVRGFLMPRVPERFTVRISLPGGPDTVLAQVQYLLNHDDYLRARGLPVDNRLRLEILRDLGEALTLLHGLGICVGDLSPNNLLFSLGARPRCYFLDCDAMRLDGDSVLAQAETPEWHVPDAAAEELATPASDAFKYGLLAVRLFAGDQQVRDARAARPRLRRGLVRLAERSLATDPALRPAPAHWFQQLDRAITRTPPAAPQPVPVAPSLMSPSLMSPPPQPAPPPPPPPPPRAFAPASAPLPSPPFVNRWTWIGVALGIVVSLVSFLWSPDPDPPYRSYRPGAALPYAATTYPRFPAPSVEPPPWPLSTAYPTLVRPPLITPSLLVPQLCPAATIGAESEIYAQRRVKTAVDIVDGFVCGLNIPSVRFALDDENPGPTQRQRFDTLAGKGPFRFAVITGVRGGPEGGPQVTVVFEPTRSGSSCWRSRLSLTEDSVASMGAVSRTSCV